MACGSSRGITAGQWRRHDMTIAGYLSPPFAGGERIQGLLPWPVTARGQSSRRKPAAKRRQFAT
jgi:hypothetical protein